MMHFFNTFKANAIDSYLTLNINYLSGWRLKSFVIIILRFLIGLVIFHEVD